MNVSGDDVENKGVVDLRRNDGLSRQDSSSSSSNSNSNSNSNNDNNSNKQRSKSVVDEEEEEEEGELVNIIADEKNRIDEAYRIGKQAMTCLS